MIVVSVGIGAEVLETIGREAAARGVTNAAITLIGAVRGCCVSVMPKDDPRGDILTEYERPFEVTGTGEIVDGVVHLHVVLGGEGVVVAGHLHWAWVRDWFVRAYVTPI